MGERYFRQLAVTAGRAATGVLGWSPDAFWTATPVELAIALEGRLGIASDAGHPVGAADLRRLMQEMPDGR